MDLTAAGTVRQARDYHGQEVEMVYDLTGTLRAGDMRVDVSERHTSVLAAASNLRLRPSQRGSASRTGVVSASGSVLRNGEPFGTIALDLPPTP